MAVLLPLRLRALVAVPSSPARRTPYAGRLATMAATAGAFVAAGSGGHLSDTALIAAVAIASGLIAVGST